MNSPLRGEPGQGFKAWPLAEKAENSTIPKILTRKKT
jgi:hypothetical protein